VAQPMFLTIREVAELLRVSRSRVYELIQRGDLAAVKIGGPLTTRIRYSAVEEYAASLPDVSHEAAV
jgi:excisionase family DNA binding protein